MAGLGEQVSSWDRSDWMDFGSRVWAKRQSVLNFWPVSSCTRGPCVWVKQGLGFMIYCQEPLLHAVAQTSFEGHVRQLVNAGRMAEALRLWDSVVEIQHLPLPDPQPIRPIPGLPPHKIVQGAKTTVEAFSFHGWGGGPSEERWSGRVLTQQMRGCATGLHRGP